MKKVIKLGIIICGRYRSCAGGKCLRALREKEGAFSGYGGGVDLELAGFTSCGGCPGGNIEYAPEEMKKNGAEVIHFATGMIIGYPPCPNLDYFKEFIISKYKIKVVYGTHPIPVSYYEQHNTIKDKMIMDWEDKTALITANEDLRKKYS